MENERDISRRDAEAQRANTVAKVVWVFRWIPGGKNNCVFRTQNCQIRVFDSLQGARQFKNELMRRACLNWQAKTGLAANKAHCRYGGCGYEDKPGGYNVGERYDIQWELLCLKLNDSTICKRDFDYENA